MRCDVAWVLQEAMSLLPEIMWVLREATLVLWKKMLGARGGDGGAL